MIQFSILRVVICGIQHREITNLSYHSTKDTFSTWEKNNLDNEINLDTGSILKNEKNQEITSFIVDFPIDKMIETYLYTEESFNEPLDLSLHDMKEESNKKFDRSVRNHPQFLNRHGTSKLYYEPYSSTEIRSNLVKTKKL